MGRRSRSGATWRAIRRTSDGCPRMTPRRGWRSTRYFERVAKLLKDLLFVVPPNMRMAEVPRWAKTAGRFRGWTGRDIHELVRLFTMSAADFLDEWFDDDAGQGSARHAGDHRRVVRADDAGLGVRLDAPLDRRGRRPLRRVGLGEGRHGRRVAGDGPRGRGRRGDDPDGRAGRPRGGQQPRPRRGRRAAGRIVDPCEGGRVQCPSEDHLPRPGRRGTSPRRRRSAISVGIALARAR